MKQPKRSFVSRLGSKWPIIVGMGGLGLLLALLWFRLGSQTFGNAAPLEAAVRTRGGDWHTILSDPLYAPYNLIVLAAAVLGHHGITSLRLVSTLFGILAAVLFYVVARQWHNTRVALLATWLFVSSGWFLHVSRLGSPEILWLVSTLAIVVVLTPNRHGRQNRLALPSTLAALCAVLYVPGMVWLVLVGLLLQRKNIGEAWQASRAGLLRLASLLMSALLVVPLGYGLYRAPGLIRLWLGLSSNLTLGPASLHPVAHNLLGVPRSLFLRSSFDSVHWLGHLPLLSSFEIVMLLVGLYFYATHLRAARARLVVILAAASWLLVGVSGLNAISLVVPVIYLVAAAGIAFVLHMWLKVFPGNPIARSFGICAVGLLVLLTSVYQTRSYFVAWRYNPQTRQAFTQKL